jgi:small subunit ribosomal protein S9
MSPDDDATPPSDDEQQPPPQPDADSEQPQAEGGGEGEGEGAAEMDAQPSERAEAEDEGEAPQPQAQAPERAEGEGAGAGEPLAEGAEQPAEEAEAAEQAQAQAERPAQEGESAGPQAAEEEAAGGGEHEESVPRVKPSVPGAHLEVDIVPEGADPLGQEEEYADRYAIEEELPEAASEEAEEQLEEPLTEPIATAAIDLAAGARYRATGKRKTAIARVTLRPGSGSYLVNGRSLEEHFPRLTLQRNIRQPLESVGYQERMDVVARLHGGGISAQAGALRHGVSRALLEADPNLRGELKRRGFLTRDSRAKERKKAGLKKARKRPQFSKR